VCRGQATYVKLDSLQQPLAFYCDRDVLIGNEEDSGGSVSVHVEELGGSEYTLEVTRRGE
jgi:hypothetical protein